MYPLSKKVSHLFGCGYSRWAPGTVGSAGACILWPLEILCPEFLLMPLWIMLCIMSVWVCYDVIDENVDKDPQWIVIDEAIAVWFIPVFYNGRWSMAWCVAWIIFRIIDITKPWPVSAMERVPFAAAAIVLDDLMAVMLALLLTKFWWG